MYVNYISHAGLEGWWQYEQMSAGRAGTVYSDLFNGNMVLEHSDTVMTGNLKDMPCDGVGQWSWADCSHAYYE